MEKVGEKGISVDSYIVNPITTAHLVVSKRCMWGLLLIRLLKLEQRNLKCGIYMNTKVIYYTDILNS